MPPRRVRFTDLARQDLAQIIGYSVAHFGEVQAKRHQLKIQSAIRSLGDFTFQSNGIEGRPDVRMKLVRPHWIVYQVAQDTVQILGLFDARRSQEALISEILSRYDETGESN